MIKLRKSNYRAFNELGKQLLLALWQGKYLWSECLNFSRDSTEKHLPPNVENKCVNEFDASLGFNKQVKQIDVF